MPSGDLSTRKRLRYRFDNIMVRGGRWTFIGFSVVFILAMTIIGLLRCISFVAGSDHPEQDEATLTRNIFVVFEQLTDPGNMDLDRQASPIFKFWAVIAAMTGVVMLSCLIGLITTGLEGTIRELRKGRSRVLEVGHTLILGWNDRVLDILRELVAANESEKAPCIVVVSEENKEDMDDFIGLNLPDTKNTRIVTRSGNPALPASLRMASIGTCKSVIVMDQCNVNASVEERTISDVAVIKTILGIAAARRNNSQLNIVAPVHQQDHRTIVSDITNCEVTTVVPDSILGKLIVETSRSVGLSLVYNELLSFDGCEMYFYHSDWGDVRFGELAFHFDDGVPMGLLRDGQQLLLNPPTDVQLHKDDKVLVLAEDDSTIHYLPAPAVIPQDLALVDRRRQASKERMLIIGWMPRVEFIVQEVAMYVRNGSSVDIMQRVESADIEQQIELMREQLPSIDINLVKGNPMTTEGLLTVRPFQYDTIIVLSQSVAGEHPDHTDSATIVILLLLRIIFKAFPEEASTTKLITEVLNSHNVALMTHAGVDDFIVSNRLVSMLLAQLSEDPHMMKVYEELFQIEGSEIYLKPASLYLDDFPVDTSFADLIRLTQGREEVCMGVKLESPENDSHRRHGVELNPKKGTKYSLQAEDCLIVLARNET